MNNKTNLNILKRDIVEPRRGVFCETLLEQEQATQLICSSPVRGNPAIFSTMSFSLALLSKIQYKF